MKKRYEILLYGCDDTTVMHMELDDDEVKTIEKLSKLSIRTSTYDCQPTLKIRGGNDYKKL